MCAERIISVLACLGALAAASAWTGEKQAAKPEEEEWDLVIRNDKVVVPPLKITKDNYIEVVGRVNGRGLEYKVPAYAIKDVLYADRDPNYSAAIEKRDEGRYPLAALYFYRALEAMTAQKWAAEYCNYGIANALYENGSFKGYKGR